MVSSAPLTAPSTLLTGDDLPGMLRTLNPTASASDVTWELVDKDFTDDYVYEEYGLWLTEGSNVLWDYRL